MANVYQVYGNASPVAPLAALMVDATAAALDGLRTVTINPINTLVRFQARAQQRRQLKGLDDRMLADIGLTRKAADKEANKPFWKA
ncbi:MAG: hypothetical protein CMM78_08755 [Rhodospirillaceae bacterium]|jgi:uncharacterized protein YjiS (DUF1127 family)|uniref:DUF1127 domain-containing protein n=1 Tax=Hwanghaeella sp. 1Z406 TaxID=3402811 RepID=UPI000C4DE6BF|nr:hypothetical protein [Rhodospirillales bacterium]MAX48283.1 hypothetical protein [Rhodospirillaceae bacterium]|tara:strand:+ start:27538 stop:27795 length:258 start_codon:yes stop_codon:yes gene_type:complete